MQGTTLTTKTLVGLRAVTQAKGRKIGKVNRIVFHPSEKRVVGLTVKRPDAALMFHRKDLFVALDGFDMEDGQVVVHDDPAATDRGAVKALGVDWDSCVIWAGMPVMTRSGDFLGYISQVSFDAKTGQVISLSTEDGVAKKALLGKRSIPAKLVRGFRRGQGVALAPVGEYDGQDKDDAAQRGAIMVDDEALNLPIQGGAAAAAGKATAVAANKAKKSVVKVKATAATQAERAKPTVQEAARKTGEAVEAGSFALGKQLGRASGMFAAFKEEYDKASKGE